MKNQPLVIGLDGGASKVRGVVVQKLATGTFIPGAEKFTQSYSHSELYDPNFRPVSLNHQFHELNSNQLQPTPGESRREAAIIQSFIAVISRLTTGEPLRLGIGLPGIKTNDGGGIAVMANGPRMPYFSERLISALKLAGLSLEEHLPAIGNDSDYCGMGEEFARGGNFRSVDNAYYLGGGTGVAEALKLEGKLIPFSSAGNWMAKLWELSDRDNVPMEKYASMEGIQSFFLKISGDDPVYPDMILSLAREGNRAAEKTMVLIASKIAFILYERMVTLSCGWQNLFNLRSFVRRQMEVNHPYRRSVFQRIVIGQRLATLFQHSKGSNLLYKPFLAELESLITNSSRLSIKVKHYYQVHLENDLICFSDLHSAPALGAGIQAWFHLENK